MKNIQRHLCSMIPETNDLVLFSESKTDLYNLYLHNQFYKWFTNVSVYTFELPW